ncbi:hypothetical protein [Dactylosporangium sp. NPDC051541]|uniref:hypothetical protein n=1 Tax=Dactylosporangium sp. NPDC051541 TaxID=3363977 RepID=UPI0037BD9140
MRTVALLVFVLVAVAACAPKPGPGMVAAPDSTPEIHAVWQSCAQAADPDVFEPAVELGLPRLPADFTPAALVVCSVGSQVRADGREDAVQFERRGTDVDALTRALRLPNAPRTDGACTADLPGVPWFAVLDATGRWLRPGIAADACGKLRIEVRDTIEHATLTTVATTVIGERKSSAAASTGCEPTWADMVGATTSMGQQFTGTPDAPTGEVRLCLYTVQASEQGTGKPAGHFDRGATLPAPTWTPLRAQLLAAGAPAPCQTHASRFALIRRPDNTLGEVYFELDGCHRILFDTPTGTALRQGSADLAKAIERTV